jgi:hypothetical protein
MNILKKTPSFILSLLLLTMICEGSFQEEVVKNVLLEVSSNSQFSTKECSDDCWLYNFPEVSPYIEDVEEHENLEVDNVFSRATLSTDSEEGSDDLKVKGSSVTTHAASVVAFGGYLFHVADYTDSRIVTCLDGGMIGCQTVFINGVEISRSYNVTWYNNYFVHKHSWGTIYSYPNKQVAKFN